MPRDSFSITYKSKNIPRGLRGLPFRRIGDEVLGKEYNLSLVFINKTASKLLNRTYRGKDSSTNVLSFRISKNSGEIFIDIDTAKHEAPDFEENILDFVLYLFIHGLLHLMGQKHGATMEKAEQKLLSKFRLIKNGKTHNSRHRHRNIRGQSSDR